LTNGLFQKKILRIVDILCTYFYLKYTIIEVPLQVLSYPKTGNKIL